MSERKLRDGDLVGEANELRDSRGRLITDSYVEQAIAEITRVGRPSLSGQSRHSPQIVVRVAPELKSQAERVASSRGMSVSALTRQALAELIERAD